MRGFIKSYEEASLHTDGKVLEIMRLESDKALPEKNAVYSVRHSLAPLPLLCPSALWLYVSGY